MHPRQSWDTGAPFDFAVTERGQKQTDPHLVSATKTPSQSGGGGIIRNCRVRSS